MAASMRARALWRRHRRLAFLISKLQDKDRSLHGATIDLRRHASKLARCRDTSNAVPDHGDDRACCDNPMGGHDPICCGDGRPPFTAMTPSAAAIPWTAATIPSAAAVPWAAAMLQAWAADRGP